MRTAARHKRGGPPLDPHALLPMFEADSQNFLLRRLRCQEDFRLQSFRPAFGGTIGGPSEEGGGSQPNPPCPRPPLSYTSRGRRGGGGH